MPTRGIARAVLVPALARGRTPAAALRQGGRIGGRSRGYRTPARRGARRPARTRAGAGDAAGVEAMADGDRARPVPVDRGARAHAELVASRHELAGALTRQVDFLVKQLKMPPDGAAAHVRS